MSDYQKPIPQPTPETQHFWDGCKDGKLLLQRCKDTGKAYFPPRPFSPYTGSKDVEVFEASGKAKLFSYVINHRPAKGFEDEAPYAIAVVELDEGPRMMSRVIGVDPGAVRIGHSVRAQVLRTGEDALLVFAPAGERQ